MKIAVDFGITNTDIAIHDNNELIFHTFITEKVDTAYILNILSELNLDEKKITHIAVTGGKSSDLENSINTIPIIKLNEIQAIGYGVKELYKINDPKFLAVSTGTGTACVASIDGEFNHLGGISVGGGTLQGLSNLITGINNPNEIEKLSKIGNKKNLDALIGEVVNNIGSLHPEITASNFCKARENTNFSIEDTTSSISNMVGEVIGTIAYLNALLIGVDNVYFIGRVSVMNSVRNGIEKRLNLAGVTGNYKDNQEFGNAIGAIAYLNANT
ncbi:MAG: pantothenate kinase [Flavobacteriales bacterium]|nr:pantothenate kinase [Flavobacteriales bacterium]